MSFQNVLCEKGHLSVETKDRFLPKVSDFHQNQTFLFILRALFVFLITDQYYFTNNSFFR